MAGIGGQPGNADAQRNHDRIVDALRTALGEAHGDQGVEAIRGAMEALDAATAEFAARRMDSAVHSALAGQHLSALP